MARIPAKSVFLERKSYRQRRLRDVARMTPFLGAVLWLLPLAWRGHAGGTATTLIYIFGVWLFLVAITAMISARIAPDPEAEPSDSGAR